VPPLSSVAPVRRACSYQFAQRASLGCFSSKNSEDTRCSHGLKAEKGTLSWERIDGGKIRFKTSSWDDAVVATRSQVLEIAMVDHLPTLVRATKPIEYQAKASLRRLRLDEAVRASVRHSAEK
jgi:hypothetical protein